MHAVAHAIAGDDADAAVANLVRDGRAVNADPNRTLLNLAEALTKVVTELPHTAQDERATDTRALELMARLGLNPRPAVDAWRKIALYETTLRERPPPAPAVSPPKAPRRR